MSARQHETLPLSVLGSSPRRGAGAEPSRVQPGQLFAVLGEARGPLSQASAQGGARRRKGEEGSGSQSQLASTELYFSNSWSGQMKWNEPLLQKN